MIKVQFIVGGPSHAFKLRQNTSKATIAPAMGEHPPGHHSLAGIANISRRVIRNRETHGANARPNSQPACRRARPCMAGRLTTHHSRKRRQPRRTHDSPLTKAAASARDAHHSRSGRVFSHFLHQLLRNARIFAAQSTVIQ